MPKKTIYDSPHYHSESKGCELVEHRMFIKNWKYGHHKITKVIGNIYEEWLIEKKCLTHNIIICKCGWERNWHFGTDSEYVKRQTEVWRNNHKIF